MTRISKLSYIFLVTITSVLFSANSILFSQTKQTLSDGKYNYETVENDPLKARIYTLDNGLKVYLTVNKNTPRIQTYIAVATGSKNDPHDAQGLSHYLEHMLLKERINTEHRIIHKKNLLLIISSLCMNRGDKQKILS
ncbi:MAG: insulinase family protein [Ignavibacteria bacterium]|nr:insulinase family protein [Ignavibacteria bacterium]